jgi:hypothetical protein
MRSEKVNVSRFDIYRTVEYHNGLFLHEDVQIALTRCLLNDSNVIEVRASVFDEIEENKRKYELREREYNDVSTHRLNAMQFEKDGSLEAAVTEYATAIQLGESCVNNVFTAFAYAYERIIVLHHKLKNNELETSYIENYLKHDLSETVREKYVKRYEKLISKK